MSQAKWIERSFFPWAIVLQTVPILAIVPLLDLWAKNDILFVEEGFRSRIIVCVIIALFPIVSNTFFGLALGRRHPYHDLFIANSASAGGRGFASWSCRAAAAGCSPGSASPPGWPWSERSSVSTSSASASKGWASCSTSSPSKGTSDYPQLYAPSPLSVCGVVTFFGFGWLGRSLAHWHVSSEPPVG